MNASMKERLLLPALVGLACMLAAGCATQGVRSEGAQWQLISRAGQIFGEGVVADRNGRLYATDIMPTAAMKQKNPGGTIWRYEPASGKTEKYMEPSGMANGLHVDRNGDLIIAQGADTGGGRAVLRRNLATGASAVLANSYEGKRLIAPNDVTSDAQGRIYFTDARYIGMDPMELPNAVYRIDAGGKITRIISDLFRPNGIEVSPDGKRLYVATNGSRQLPINPNGPAKDRFPISDGGLVAYDLDANGNVSNGRLILSRTGDAPDGMAMDTDGNLYVAMHNGNPKDPKSDIVVLNPAGEVIERLSPPPGVLSTQLGFGRGADAGTLYMTQALPWGLWRIKTVRRGHYF